MKHKLRVLWIDHDATRAMREKDQFGRFKLCVSPDTIDAEMDNDTPKKDFLLDLLEQRGKDCNLEPLCMWIIGNFEIPPRLYRQDISTVYVQFKTIKMFPFSKLLEGQGMQCITGPVGEVKAIQWKKPN